MRAWLLIVLVLAALAAGCGGEEPAPVSSQSTVDAPALQEFTSSEGGFAVLMPGTPTATTQEHDSPVGSITVHMFFVESGEAGYGVMYNDYPASLVESVDLDVEEFLDAGRDGALANVGGTLVEEEPVSLDGHPGREIHAAFTLEGEPAELRERCYLVGNRLYQVMTVFPEGEEPNDMAAFFESFKLL